MSSAIVLAGASSIRPPRAESTIAFAVSRSPGPQPTSTGPLVSAVRRAARAAKRSADQRLAARPAPDRRTTSRSRGSTPQRPQKASTRASAAEARRAKLSRELAEGAARGREIEGRERPPPTPGVHRNDRVQNPVAREQRRLASLHDPGEAGARQPPAERRRDRQRVDDVTERRELHERDVHRKRST